MVKDGVRAVANMVQFEECLGCLYTLAFAADPCCTIFVKSV